MVQSPPKGQELDDHYCGRIRIRVGEFMQDLDKNLWEMGVASKTKHNEAAPAQHELAPDLLHRQHRLRPQPADYGDDAAPSAKKHGLACLLHEKPFANVNGSGKHNNWSLCTDTGENLLDPGKNPESNLQFLLMLSCLHPGGGPVRGSAAHVRGLRGQRPAPGRL